MSQQGFAIKADTGGVVDALDNRLAAAFARESGPALEEVADGVIASIRRRQIWPGGDGKVLKKGLWRGSVRHRRSGAEIDMGWSGEGAAFGPSHEFGYKKSKWQIKPVNTRSSTKHSNKRIGQPIKMLRFVVGGRVVYARGVTVSKPRPSLIKPHFQPALESYPVEQRMGKAMDRAVDRSGL